MDKLTEKLAEIRKAYIERLTKVIEVNPGFRVDAVTVQMDVQYLLQLVETQAQALNEAHTAMLDALSVMEMEGRDFNLMPQCTIQEAAEKLEALTQV